jgi:hypothetical protein
MNFELNYSKKRMINKSLFKHLETDNNTNARISTNIKWMIKQYSLDGIFRVIAAAKIIHQNILKSIAMDKNLLYTYIKK